MCGACVCTVHANFGLKLPISMSVGFDDRGNYMGKASQPCGSGPLSCKGQNYPHL